MLTRRQFIARALVLPFLPQRLLFQGAFPNIVLITADDLGYGSLGCYGQLVIQTPNLDTLASQGSRFTQAYAPTCICAPSRFSLITGQIPRFAANNGTLIDSDRTIAQKLQGVGYKTACIGKWGLSYNGLPGLPNNWGFDYFYGYRTHSEAHSYYLPYIWENETYTPLPANQNGQKGQYLPDLFTAKALEWISQTQQPFFLYLSYNLPHVNSQTWEFEVPTDAPYSAMPWSQDEKNYASMITRLDAYIGQIIQALPPNTIVIFTSDNGSDYPEMLASNGKLRAGKSTLYEGGIRVPLIVSGPGVAPGVEERPAWLVNFSKVALSGNTNDFLQPEPMYWAYYGRELSEAVRLGNFKGVRFPDRFELYDLASDPGETTNLSATYPEITWQMGAIMDRYCPEPKVCKLHVPLISE